MNVDFYQLDSNEEFQTLNPSEKTRFIEGAIEQLPENLKEVAEVRANRYMEEKSRMEGIGRVYNEERVIDSIRQTLPANFDKLDDESKVNAIDKAKEEVEEKAAELDPVNKNDTGFYSRMQLSGLQRQILGKEVGEFGDKFKRFTGGLIQSVASPFNEEGTTEFLNRNLPTNPEYDTTAASKFTQAAGDFVGQIAQFAAISALAGPSGGTSLGLLGVRAGAVGTRVALATSFAQNSARKFQENYNLATGEMGLSEDEALVSGIAGMPGAVIDSFGEVLILRGIKLGSASKAFASMSAAEKASEIVKKGSQIIKSPTAMATISKNLFSGFMKEAVTETLGDAATGWGGYATTGHEGFIPKAESLWDSFWIGGVLGGTAQVALGAKSDYRNQTALKSLGEMDQNEFMSMTEKAQNDVAALMDSERYAEAASYISNYKKALGRKAQGSGAASTAAGTPAASTPAATPATSTPAASTGAAAASTPAANAGATASSTTAASTGATSGVPAITPLSNTANIESAAEAELEEQGNAQIAAALAGVDRPMDSPNVSKEYEAASAEVQSANPKISGSIRSAMSPDMGSAMTLDQVEKAITTQAVNEQAATEEEVPATPDQQGNVPEGSKENVSEAPAVPATGQGAAAGQLDGQAAAQPIEITPEIRQTQELVQAFVSATSQPARKKVARDLVKQLQPNDVVVLDGEEVTLESPPSKSGTVKHKGTTYSLVDMLVSMDDQSQIGDLIPRFTPIADLSPAAPEVSQTPTPEANVSPEPNVAQPEAAATPEAAITPDVAATPAPEAAATPEVPQQPAAPVTPERKKREKKRAESKAKKKLDENEDKQTSEVPVEQGKPPVEAAAGQTEVGAKVEKGQNKQKIQKLEKLISKVEDAILNLAGASTLNRLINQALELGFITKNDELNYKTTQKSVGTKDDAQDALEELRNDLQYELDKLTAAPEAEAEPDADAAVEIIPEIKKELDDLKSEADKIVEDANKAIEEIRALENKAEVKAELDKKKSKIQVSAYANKLQKDGYITTEQSNAVAEAANNEGATAARAMLSDILGLNNLEEVEAIKPEEQKKEKKEKAPRKKKAEKWVDESLNAFEQLKSNLRDRITKAQTLLDYKRSLLAESADEEADIDELEVNLTDIFIRIKQAKDVFDLTEINNDIDQLADSDQIITQKEIEKISRKVKKQVKEGALPTEELGNLAAATQRNEDGRLFQVNEERQIPQSPEEIDQTTPEWKALGKDAQEAILSMTPEELAATRKFIADLRALGIDQSASAEDKAAAVEIERALVAGKYPAGLNESINSIAPARAAFQKAVIALKGAGSVWKEVTLMQFDMIALNWLKTGGSIQSYYAQLPEIVVQSEFSGTIMRGGVPMVASGELIATGDISDRQIIQEAGTATSGIPSQPLSPTVAKNRTIYSVPFSPVPNKIVLTVGYYGIDTLIHETDHNMIVTGMAQRIIEAQEGGVDLWDSALKAVGMKRNQLWTVEAHEKWVEARAAWMRGMTPSDSIFSKIWSALRDIYKALYSKSILTKNRNITLERAFEKIYSIDSLPKAELRQKVARDIGKEAGLLLGHVPFEKLPYVQKVVDASKLISKLPSEQAKYIRKELGSNKSTVLSAVAQNTEKQFSKLEIDAIVIAQSEVVRGATTVAAQKAVGAPVFDENSNYFMSEVDSQFDPANESTPEVEKSAEVTASTPAPSNPIDGRMYFSILNNQWVGFDAAAQRANQTVPAVGQQQAPVTPAQQSGQAAGAFSALNNQFVGFEGAARTGNQAAQVAATPATPAAVAQPAAQPMVNPFTALNNQFVGFEAANRPAVEAPAQNQEVAPAEVAPVEAAPAITQESVIEELQPMLSNFRKSVARRAAVMIQNNIEMLTQLRAQGVTINLFNTRADLEKAVGVAPKPKGNYKATAYVLLDGSLGIAFYSGAFSSDAQFEQSLGHEARHIAQYIFERTAEGQQALEESQSIFDPKSPNFDKKLNSFMKKEYFQWDKLSNRSKVREAGRAIMEGKAKGETSGFKSGIFSYLRRFLAYVNNSIQPNSPIARYIQGSTAELDAIMSIGVAEQTSQNRDYQEVPFTPIESPQQARSNPLQWINQQWVGFDQNRGDNVETVIQAAAPVQAAEYPIIAVKRETGTTVIESGDTIYLSTELMNTAIQSQVTQSDIIEVEVYTSEPYTPQGLISLANQHIKGTVSLPQNIKAIVEKVIVAAGVKFAKANNALTSAISKVISQAEKLAYQTYINASRWTDAVANRMTKDLVDWTMGLNIPQRISNIFSSIVSKLPASILSAFAFLSLTPYSSNVGTFTNLTSETVIENRPVKKYSSIAPVAPINGTRLDSIVTIDGNPFPAVEVNESSSLLVDSNPLPDSQAIYDFVNETNDNNGQPYIIVSKREGVLRLYDKDGELMHTSRVLVGKEYGDVIAKPQTLERIEATDKGKVTTSGRFQTRTSRSAEYGEVVPTDNLEGSNYRIAIHTVCLKFAHERRAERLQGKLSNRISFGCINVPLNTSKTLNNAMREGGIVYVAPDFQETSEFVNDLRTGRSRSSQEMFEAAQPVTESDAQGLFQMSEGRRSDTATREHLTEDGLQRISNEAIAALQNGGTIIGRGGNNVVYDIPNSNYVIRIPKSELTKDGNPPEIKDSFSLVEDRFNGRNFGQVVATSGRVELLIRQNGVPAGIDPLLRQNFKTEEGNAVNKKLYDESIKRIASMPQSAFDKLASDLKFINDNGFMFDPSKANNILVDTDSDTFNIVDVATENKADYNSDINDMLVPLMDNAFAGKYADESLADSYSAIFDKSLLASAKAGILAELDGSGLYSAKLANRTGVDTTNLNFLLPSLFQMSEGRRGVKIEADINQSIEIDKDLTNKVSEFITGKIEEAPIPSAIYRGIPKRADFTRNEKYTHVSPWASIAIRAGKGAFYGGQENDLYSFEPLKNQKYYRGGALAESPLEPTTIRNSKGATWSELLKEAKDLYEKRIERFNRRSQEDQLGLMNDYIKTLPKEQVEKQIERAKKKILDEVIRDFKNSTFESDIDNKAGRWSMGQIQNTPYNAAYPSLMTNEEMEMAERQNRIDQLFQMGGGRRAETLRFNELTVDLYNGGNYASQEQIDAWKEANPKKWEELTNMRAQVLRDGGWDVGPVYHGSNQNFEEFDNSKTDDPNGFWFSLDREWASRHGLTKKFFLKNAKNFGGEDYTIQNSNQAKSAEPISAGLKITPDQWADTSRDSILYQMSKGRRSDASLWDAPSQEITSADTSINDKKTAATFTKVKFAAGTVNADIGGGRFDNATELLKAQGVTNIIFDPFNRSADQNMYAASLIRDGQADTTTVNNVLNVIQDAANRDKVIRQAANAVKPNGVSYFLIYEGNGTGVGRETSKGWQENRKTKDYLAEISAHYGSVKVKNGIIEATSPVKNQLFQMSGGRRVDENEISDDDLRQLGGMYQALARLNARLGGMSPINGKTMKKLDKANNTINDALNQVGGKSKSVSQAEKQKVLKLIRKSFSEVASAVSEDNFNRMIKDARQYAFAGEAMAGDSFNPQNNIQYSKDMSDAEKERFELQQRIKKMAEILRRDSMTGRLKNTIKSHMRPMFHEVAGRLTSLMSRGINNILSAFNDENSDLIKRFSDQIFLFSGKQTDGDPMFIEDFLKTIDEVEDAMFNHMAREFVAYNELYFIQEEGEYPEIDAILANFERGDNESAVDYYNRLVDMKNQIEAIYSKIEGVDDSAESTDKQIAKKAETKAKLRKKREDVINKNQNDLRMRFPSFEDYLADKELRHGGAHSEKFNEVMKLAFDWATSVDVSGLSDEDVVTAHHLVVTMLTGGNHSSIMHPWTINRRESLIQSWKDVASGLYGRVRGSSLVRPIFVAAERNTIAKRLFNSIDAKFQANLENFNVWVDRISKYPAVRSWMDRQFLGEFQAGAFTEASNAAKNSVTRLEEITKAYNDDLDNTVDANPMLWAVSNLLQYNVGSDPRKEFIKSVRKARNSVNPKKVANKANSNANSISEAARNSAALESLLDGIDLKSDTAWDEFSKVVYDRMGYGNPDLSDKRSQLLSDMQNLFMEGVADQIFVSEVLMQKRFTTVNNYLPMMTDRIDGSMDKIDIMDMDANREYMSGAAGINSRSNETRKAASPDRILGLDLFKSVERKLFRNAIDVHSKLPTYFLVNEIFRFKAVRTDDGVYMKPVSPLVKEIWGDGDEVKGQVDAIKEKIVHQLTQIYRMTEPPNSLVSAVRTANSMIQSMMLSGMGQVFQQAGAALVDYSARESGNSRYLIDATIYYSKNYEKVRNWLFTNYRDLYDRGDTQGILENEKSFRNLGSELDRIDNIKDKMDTLRRFMTLSLRYGDKIGSELIFIAEHMKAVEQAGLTPDIKSYDIELYSNPALTTRAAGQVSRYVGPSSAAGRSWWMSDHKQAYSVLRALTGSFQSSAHNMSSQMLGAARNYMDLMKDGTAESRAEARSELRKIGAIMAQQATFTTLRHMFNGMLILATVSAIRSAFDDEDDAIEQAQLNLEKVRSNKRMSKAEKERAVNEAERQLADAKAIRRAVVNMKQQASADAWRKGMIRDQVANLHVFNSFGDAFLPKMFMMPINSAMEESFKATNEATIGKLKKERSGQLALGNRAEAAKLQEKITDMEAIDYIPLFYEKKDKSGFGGIIGGVLDPVYSGYKEASEDIMREDRDFLTARAFIPDLISYMAAAGVGQADVNRVARQLQRIDDELSTNRLEEKERTARDIQELTNKSGRRVTPRVSWEQQINPMR